GDGMGTVHEARAHQRRLRTEHARPDLIQRLAAQIVVAVARCTRKAGLGDSEFLECLHYPPRIYTRDSVYLRKTRCKFRLAVLREALNFRRYITQLHRL